MNETNDASAMFAPIWRRKWLILTVGVLVALGTYFYYKHQHPHYTATTQIYLGAGAEEQVTVQGAGAASGKKGGALEPTAQAVLINSAIIKRSVREQLKKQKKTPIVRAALTGIAKAKATEKSEFITLTSEARNARGAALLADLTAQTYVKRQNGKYHRTVEEAISLARRQMRRIEASQEARSAETVQTNTSANGKGSKTGSAAKPRSASTSVALQVANLSTKINQLESNLGIVSVKQIQPAAPKQVSASPKRNAIFGLVVGLVLASFVAYALARFDSRLRSLAELEAAFGAGILTALAAVRRPIVIDDGEPRPSNQLREPLQRLHTTLQVGSVNEQDGRGRPRKILFVSAHGGDGQSTVIADLALTQRDAGASVAVVEADLRRPVLSKLLAVGERPGLADVLEGRLSIAEALQGVGATSPSVPPLPGSGSLATLHAPITAGAVSVLVGGMVANPSAALAGGAMGETLQALAADHDYVLIDAPPPLEVSDVIPLLALVDGIIIIARVGQTRQVPAQRLVQLLARTPSAPLLGVVANGVSQRDIEKYGFSTYSGGSRRGRLFRL